LAIAWRQPHAAPNLHAFAQRVYLWPHDTISREVSQEEINAFDDVLWLSEFQRKQWVGINPGFARFRKLFGNGIEPAQFRAMKDRTNPRSCIYASNYSRGLDILLDLWPDVRTRFPDATLDLYYGWHDLKTIKPEKYAKMHAQVANYADLGVKEHGMVGQDELNEAFHNASLWTYPCTFPETFCITALRAQFSGTVPVIINYAALKETVRHGFKCISKEEYLSILLKALGEAEKISLKERKNMGAFILQEFTWEKLALKLARKFDRNAKHFASGSR
jgi:glycosyltransferase involved in cell wall biosynthesis